MIYDAREAFSIGGSKVLRSSDHDDVTLVGAGVTLHECLKAAELLGGEGIRARVLDCYSVKPLDAATVHEAAAATSGRIVVVEDHHPEGGIGSAVTECLLSNGPMSLHVAHLAVRGIPGSGTARGALGVGRDRRRPHRGRCARARARRLRPVRALPTQSGLTASAVRERPQ